MSTSGLLLYFGSCCATQLRPHTPLPDSAHVVSSTGHHLRPAAADVRSCRRRFGCDGRLATVYALLTGRPPVEGGNLPELIMKIRDEEPQRPKEFQLSIDDMFEGIVLRMLAKRPEDRFQEPADLVTELERIAMFQNLEV